MTFFPQLSTEALVQYPVRKRIMRRAIRNLLQDGSSIQVADFRNAQTQWMLQYVGLSDAEREVFESFLHDLGGALNSFVFAEPGANLLRWSERLAEDTWVSDPLLAIAQRPEALSSFSVHRLSNNAQSTQSLKQVIGASAAYRYCFSFDMRADALCKVEARIASGGASIAVEATAGPEWRRCVVTGSPGGNLESMECAIGVPAGAAIEVAKLQVELQTAPSAYQPTNSRSNIYPFTRLHREDVRFRADGPDNHALAVELISLEIPE